MRSAAETDARQRGLGSAETDQVGRDAADEVPDPGPDDPPRYLAAQIDEDDHAVDGIMIQVRKMSDLRLVIYWFLTLATAGASGPNTLS